MNPSVYTGTKSPLKKAKKPNNIVAYAALAASAVSMIIAIAAIGLAAYVIHNGSNEGKDGIQGLPGLNGATGPRGATGLQGAPGTDGSECWDINNNHICDNGEDTNNDAKCDSLDCSVASSDTAPAGNFTTIRSPTAPCMCNGINDPDTACSILYPSETVEWFHSEKNIKLFCDNSVSDPLATLLWLSHEEYSIYGNQGSGCMSGDSFPAIDSCAVAFGNQGDPFNKGVFANNPTVITGFMYSDAGSADTICAGGSSGNFALEIHTSTFSALQSNTFSLQRILDANLVTSLEIRDGLRDRSEVMSGDTFIGAAVKNSCGTSQFLENFTVTIFYRIAI